MGHIFNSYVKIPEYTSSFCTGDVAVDADVAVGVGIGVVVVVALVVVAVSKKTK